uniref:Secreted protein n=1 Tax=Parascaris equorum TaxID=6256 RepID=A0A914RSD8_PAREQ
MRSSASSRAFFSPSVVVWSKTDLSLRISSSRCLRAASDTVFSDSVVYKRSSRRLISRFASSKVFVWSAMSFFASASCFSRRLRASSAPSS